MKLDIDEMLREALDEEDRELWDQLDDATPLELLTDSFQGRAKWLDIMAMGLGLVFLAIGTWALMGFWEATADSPAMRWGLGVIYCMWALWALKVWSWMQIQRNGISREIKRLELQIVRLGAEVRSHRDQGATPSA